MTEEQGIKEGRKRRSAEEVRELLKEFESSGMAAGRFCQEKGLSRGTLYRYLRLSDSRERGRRTRKAVSEDGRIVAVEVTAERQSKGQEKGSLGLVLAMGYKIEVEEGFDEGTLERLLAVLERR
jgi:hypothetical protein